METSPMLRLPTELMELVAGALEPNDILALRLSCNEVNYKIDKAVLARCFTSMGFLLHSRRSMEALEAISTHRVFSKTLKHVYISVARLRKPIFEVFQAQRQRFQAKRETRMDVKQAYIDCMRAFEENEAWLDGRFCYRSLRTALSNFREFGNPVSLAFEALVADVRRPISRSLERHGRPSSFSMQKSVESDIGHYGIITGRPYYQNSVHGEIVKEAFELCFKVESLTLGCMWAPLSWNALHEAEISETQMETSTRWLTSLDLCIGGIDSRRDISLPFVDSIHRLLKTVRNNNRLECLQISMQFRRGYPTGVSALRDIIAKMTFPALRKVSLNDMSMSLTDIEMVLLHHRKTLRQAKFHGTAHQHLSYPYLPKSLPDLEQQQRIKIGRPDLDLSIMEVP